jgi:hypothetical protein
MVIHERCPTGIAFSLLRAKKALSTSEYVLVGRAGLATAS